MAVDIHYLRMIESTKNGYFTFVGKGLYGSHGIAELEFVVNYPRVPAQVAGRMFVVRCDRESVPDIEGKKALRDRGGFRNRRYRKRLEPRQEHGDPCSVEKLSAVQFIHLIFGLGVEIKEGGRFHQSNSPSGNRFFQTPWLIEPMFCPPGRRGDDPRQMKAWMN